MINSAIRRLVKSRPKQTGLARHNEVFNLGWKFVYPLGEEMDF
jgi:hypothetical protein